MEVLLGAKPEAPTDESQREEVEKEAETLARKERVANAGGQLMGAAFAFLGEMFSGREETQQTAELAETFKERLCQGLEKGEDGKLRMTITFPDEEALDNLAKSLAQIVDMGK
jgi:hypothetical protein